MVKPDAVSATSMPFNVLPEMTLPSGMTPPTVVFCDEPLISMPSPALPTDVALSRCPKPLLMSSPSRQPLLPCGSVSQLAWARPSARVAFRTGSRARLVLLSISPLFGGAVAVAFWVMRALAVATGLFWPIPSSTPAPRAPDFLVGSAPWMTVLILLSI